jgi:nucleoside-diphosphate-sugar epimerase
MWLDTTGWWAAPSGANCNGRDSKISSGARGGKSNLLDIAAVQKFFAEIKPEFVFMAAAKVGGIHANNTQPAAFLFENLQVQNNLIHAAYQAGVRKLLFLGSSCIYPKLAPQPLKEEYLLTRRTGAHKPMVCRRKDRRIQTLPGVSPAIRLRFHQRHADKHVWAKRQL